MLGPDCNLKYQTTNGYDIIYKKVVLTLDKIEVFKQMVQNAKRIVFFGGAGVSTESGIPDFRSEDGLYHLKYPYPQGRNSQPSLFYGTYKRILSFL